VRGFTLIPVVLAMSVVAAVAFLLNRDTGINVRMVSQQAETERARYAAEAGLQAINYAVQKAGCSGPNPDPISHSIAGATYTASAAPKPGSKVDLTSVGTYNTTSVTLTRAGVAVYQPRTTRVVQPTAVTGQDTFIDWGQERNFGGDIRMRLQSTRYSPLVKIPLTDLPAATRVVPWYDAANAKLQPGAVLSLYQFDIASSFSGQLRLEARPVVRSWVAGTRAGGGSPDGATWSTYDGVNGWAVPGVGYGPVPLASTPYSAAIGWVDWDVTAAAEAWLGGVHPNHGFWISETGGTIGNTGYVASNDTANPTWRPKLTLSVQQPCGAVSGGTTIIPLSTDAYVRSGSDANHNFGGAPFIYVNSGNPERRVILRYDPTIIPPGSVVKSAVLRLYCRQVLTPSSKTKRLNLYYVMEPWTEGTLNGTGSADGATWNTRDGAAAWSVAGVYYYTSTILATGRDEASGAQPLPGDFTSGWVTFDLTSMTQSWVDGVYANHGLLLRLENWSDVFEFDSRASAGGNAPQLVVVWQ
jgi:hypothetical protein